MLFLSKLDINIANHMISQVVANIQAFDLPVFVQLLKKVFIKVLEVFLHLFGIDGLSLRVDAGSNHVGALIHVREQDGGADARLCMETGAAVAVPARADLKVERAVNPVLLCTKNGRQMLRHRKIQQQKVIFIRLLV